MFSTLPTNGISLADDITTSTPPTEPLRTGTDACPHMRDLRANPASWPRTVTAPHVFSPMPSARVHSLERRAPTASPAYLDTE